MQLPLRSIATSVAGAFALCASSLAHSTERNPLTYVTTIENPIIHTTSHRVHSLSSFDLSFHLHQGRQQIKLSLSPNHDIITEGATISYLNANGEITRAELIDRLVHRVYLGHTWLQHHEGAEWTNVGWARITVKRDGDHPIFEGAFRVDGDHHHIQTKRHYISTKHVMDPRLDHVSEDAMVLWRDSDIGPRHSELKRDIVAQPSCLSDDLSFNNQPDHPVYMAMMTKREALAGPWGAMSTRSLRGRQIDGTTSGNSAGVNLTSTIGDSSGCPTSRKVALIGVATDCTYTTALGSPELARENIINQINSASVQYENSFNISLGIQNLTVSEAECPAAASSGAAWNIDCSESVTIQDRLNLFSAWRGARSDSNAYWTLLSTCNTGSAVGLAWLGQACVNTAASDGSDTVSSANIIIRTSTEWQVIAHETGHTFGAVHDCTSATCNDGVTVAAQQCCPLSTSTCNANQQFIMNPSTGPNITLFSPCTIGNICYALGHNSVKSTCLTANRDVTTITGSECGNGIVESGEECDCGGASGCANNKCCDAATCKFTSGSVCDPSNEDCCTHSCQYATVNTVCRASTGTCNPEEVCPGNSAVCPADVTTPDGTSCGSSLYCASGQCTSRDLQCKSIMGSLTQGNDTSACSDDGCQISCQSPSFGSNVCYSMQQNFLDGTPCGGDGKCANGFCKGKTLEGEIREWVHGNKILVISLAVVFGLLAISIMGSCVISCFRRTRLAPPGAGGIRSREMNGRGSRVARDGVTASAAAGKSRSRRPDRSGSRSGSTSRSDSSGRQHRSHRTVVPPLPVGVRVPGQIHPQMGQIRAGPNDYFYEEPLPYNTAARFA